MAKSRRGFAGANQDRVRTHLFFSSKLQHHASKRKRRTHNKLHQLMHRKDEMVQTGPIELEPSLWSGNQRVLHFGPKAQRDPFFYYYPKGWDVLYPAHFGFFPYRTTKYRGTSSTICIGAFGTFLLLGGVLMLCLAHFSMENSPLYKFEFYYNKPVQLAGSTFLVIGVLLVITSLLCTLLSFKFLDGDAIIARERPRFTILTQAYKEPIAAYEKSPYQGLPPPALPVLENKYTQLAMFSPQSELKLYPPVLPGCSTLSLHDRCSSFYFASPYNTLRAVSATCQTLDRSSSDDVVKENPRAGSLRGVRRRYSDLASQFASRRTKSAVATVKVDKISRRM